MVKVIYLYECPKCRQLRSEDTYTKNGVYYSTCKTCRKNKGIEENYSNLSINKLAAIEGAEYASLNTNNYEMLGKSDSDRIKRKSSVVNAHTFRLIKDYSEVPSNLENNYKFINMLKRLSSIDVDSKGVDEIRSVLTEDFKYNIPKHKLGSYNIDVQVITAGKQKCFGQGSVVVPLPTFDLKPEGLNSKKEMRSAYFDNKPELVEKMLKEKKLECYICKKPLTVNTLTVDHVQPIALGGSNDLENLEFCCHDCNNLKDAKTVEEFSVLTLKLETVGVLENDLLNENKNLLETQTYAEKQIEYYTLISGSMESKIAKNKHKVSKYREYVNAVKELINLEKKLNI